MSAKTKWRIELFGEPRVSVGGQWVTRFRTRRAALLLARLALENAPVRRDVLVEWLWPDSLFEVGRNRLSVTLSALRRSLELPNASTKTKLFWGNHDLVGLNFDEVQCDALEFEDLIKRAHSETHPAQRASLLREALKLWRAPLWSGEEFDWLSEKATRTNDLLCQVALSLNELDAEAGLEALQRAYQVEPTHEGVAAALLRSLVVVGKTEEANRVWREFEQRLRSEKNRAPSTETRALVRRLLETHEIASAPPQRERLALNSNRFFGRQSEMEQLAGWLSRGSNVQLITLSGGSGHGKTRLALEVARKQAASFDSVHIVSLMGQHDPRRLLEVIGDHLHAPRASGNNPLERIARAIGERRVLLVLDNFEHLTAAASDVERLLRRLPSLVCLLTSRCLLEIAGGQEMVLSPLPVPSKPEGTTATTPDATLLEEWARNPAMRLFADRARVVSPTFRLHVGNARAVAHLCRTLEGVPLALELAAARSLVLSPAQIEEYLTTHLDILERETGRAAEERHRSLRAALDWSYELLSPTARRLFRRLSVFRGSWTLERAHAVCGVSPRDDKAVIVRAHEELRRYSLIEGEDEGNEFRFRFLETVRLYSRELTARDDKREIWRSLEKRHALEFTGFAQNAVRFGRGQRSSEWVHLLERDLPDLRAAFHWALDHDEALALRLAASLWWYWFSTSRLDEGRECLGKALAASQHVPTSLLTNEEEAPERINWRAEALGGAGFLAWRQGDLATAIELSQQARDLCREEGDTRALTYSLIVLQLAALVRCEFEMAHALGQECLQLARADGDQQAEAFALHLLGGEAEAKGDPRAAWSLQEQSVALFDAVDSVEGKAWALFNWGNAARRLGEYERAISLCAQGRKIFESIASREGAAYCDVYAGLTCCDAGDKSRAQMFLQEGLKELFALQAIWGVAITLEGLARTHFDDSDQTATIAIRAWSAAQQIRSMIIAPVPPADVAGFAEFENKLRKSLRAPSFEAAWETGRTLSLEQIVRAMLGT